ncbi:MAG TPA: SAM-dependent methyltransferase, partial [Pirellulales bacterium]|nr:SAM-dependent methyltransferase [Pirellulales bacterium]
MLENSKGVGCVYLVGAGPGDPGLITMRGGALLRRANVVLYDFLVNPLILQFVQGDTETICLGRHGKGRLLSQKEINQKMIDFAIAGKIVVRLKAGDPAVFARVAEETDALDAAGVLWEIVPGITASFAAPSYAGISVTNRDHASAVAMVT